MRPPCKQARPPDARVQPARLISPHKTLFCRSLGLCSVVDNLGKSPSVTGEELIESKGGSETGSEHWGETLLSSPKSTRFSTRRFTSDSHETSLGQSTYIRDQTVVHTVHMTEYDEEEAFRESRISSEGEP